MIEQQLKMKQGSGPMTMPSANGNAQSMAMAAAQQPAQVAAGQPDYSKQWAEYYRSIGKNDEAEAIESQIKPKVSRVIAELMAKFECVCYIRIIIICWFVCLFFSFYSEFSRVRDNHHQLVKMRTHPVLCQAIRAPSNRCQTITISMLSIMLEQQRPLVKVITAQLNHTTHTVQHIQVNSRHQINRNRNRTAIKSNFCCALHVNGRA